MPILKLLIFDLDGTLIDSKKDIVLSVNRAFNQLGFPSMPEEQIGAEIGRGSEYLFKRLLGEATSIQTIETLVAGFKAIYKTHLLDHTLLYPGVHEALSYYQSIPKVVVTNKNQAFADRIVDGLGLRRHFQGVFGSEAFPTQKPDPGPLLAVCKRWNAHPSHTAIIGDSEFDLLAGKAANMLTVGALYGFSDSQIFKRYAPDFKIDSAAELIGLFETTPSPKEF